MQRLLSMVPWIAAHDGPTLDEVCARFDLTPKELAADLEVMWLVGLPPYTPDALIDVVQEGDRVWIHFADVFDAPSAAHPRPGRRPAHRRRLACSPSPAATPTARSPAAWPSWPRCSASRPTRCSTSTSALGGAEVLDVLRTAVADHRRVHLDYYSYGRDVRTERDVDPYVVHAEDGSLYVLGYCHLAGGERRFRVDRIASAALLDERFEPPPDAAAAGVFQPDDDDPRVVLDLAPSAAWVAEAYPVEARGEPGGDGLAAGAPGRRRRGRGSSASSSASVPR